MIFIMPDRDLIPVGFTTEEVDQINQALSESMMTWRAGFRADLQVYPNNLKINNNYTQSSKLSKTCHSGGAFSVSRIFIYTYG